MLRNACHRLVEADAWMVVQQRGGRTRAHEDRRDRTGDTMAVAVLAGMVQVEPVVRVLDGSDPQPAICDRRDEAFDEVVLPTFERGPLT